MKNLFLALLLLPSFLFAQDSFKWDEQPKQPQQEPKPLPRPEIQPQEQERVYEFDQRCFAPLSYAFNMIRIRRSGITLDEVLGQMALEYETGALRDIPVEILADMLEIVRIVYSAESVATEDHVVAILLLIERKCQAVIQKEKEDAKKREEIHT